MVFFRYDNGHIFVTHFSFCHPFLNSILISRFPYTEHSGNVLCGQGGANPSAGTPGARVGTVYGAKRMIECEIVRCYI